MKKTLIALFALAGFASANSTDSITLGSWFTNTSGTAVLTVDAVQGKSKGENTTSLGLTGADGLSYGGFTFSMNVNEMLYSTPLTVNDSIQITQITLASNSQHDSEQTGNLSITLGGQTYVSEAGIESRKNAYGTITYNFTGNNVFTLDINDTLTASIINTTKVCIGVFKGQTGVDGITAPTGYEVWQSAVKLTGTRSIPEPTTATLSLLALAGLAARRRRR